MSLSGIGGGFSLPNVFSGNASSAAEKLNKSAADEFLEYAKQSPAERIRAAILQELGITEEELEAMPAEARDAMEKTIAEKLKEKVEQAAEKKTGMIVDVTV